MQKISNTVLAEAYEKALDLKLDPDFISLLSSEMQRRGMAVKPPAGMQLTSANK
ncbi:sporulation histidine kinase inhibitor Sda [Alteribacillus sp. HJP-4]|uniref:sporulation histidine kinase inhibitor Sda n=1 Tax=Alteribacillus sp. HJP-4 TaxID=2775394 RepID=UPI0035CCD0AA